MTALVGINSDGAVYYQDGDDWIWIPDAAAFASFGFNWSDIDWEDTLPTPASNPYSASDNPPGNAPPPDESPSPDQPVPTEPSGPSEPSGPAPIVAIVGPANIVAGYSLTPQGQVVANEFAPYGSIEGPITLTEGYTVYDVDGQAIIAPVGSPPTLSAGDGSDVPLDGTVYGLRQPAGNQSGTTLAPTYNGTLTAQGAHTQLLSAMQNEGQNGIMTAQIIANTMGNAVA